MKISICTTGTRSYQRGDNIEDAFNCYWDLSDELVAIDGGGKYPDGADLLTGDQYCEYRIKYYEWPQEFNWPFIGEQFTRGYEACTGDWVIRLDIDTLIHENDFEAIRQACIDHNDQPAFTMLKRQFVLPDRFNIKSRLVLAVNKGKFGDRIKFDSGGDLCQASLDGEYIEPGTVPDVKIPVWNYEKLLKTKEQIAEDQGRMERAWHRHFGRYQMKSDGTNENAYAKWYLAQQGKFNKPQELIPLDAHPKYVQETIQNLKPEQWGYNGFGLIEGKVYA